MDYTDPKNWHPAAEAFALLDEESEGFRQLVEDIKEQGLNNPITLYKGKVLDGRNRARACKDAGISPETVEWSPKKGQTPESWSASQNVVRRHLTADQRSVSVDELRGHTMFKKLRAEYKENEKEYSQLWKKVKSGELSLSTLVRQMDYIVGGRIEEDKPFTVAQAAVSFLKYLSYERVHPIYEKRKDTIDKEKKALFSESWALVRDAIYNITSDLHDENQAG